MKKILVTGGAGFIGSNLVEALLHKGYFVRVADNLLTGYRENLLPFLDNPNFEWLEGDLSDLEFCHQACAGMDGISHQAALGSVPRSIARPFDTVRHNLTAFVNLAFAAKEAGIRRLVYASSSSVYGDHPDLPKREDRTGKPLSPYAITKLGDELFAQNFAQLYGLECIGFRYFNIFGPRQSPKGAYAAVIPLFVQACLTGQAAYINGDGSQSRDFTYVANAVQANIRALETDNHLAINQVYNIGCGGRFNLLQLWDEIAKAVGTDLKPIFREPRAGDVAHSQADISKAQSLLGYQPDIEFKEGIELTVKFWREQS